MGDVTFNGISASSLGLVVQSFPDEYYPERDVEVTHIPGRNGDIIIDKGSYKNDERVYSFACAFNGTRTFNSVARSVIEWLHSAKGGYAILSDTYSPDVYRMAMFNESGSIVNGYDQGTGFQISFTCKPQKYVAAENPTIIQDTNQRTITNDTQNIARPLIQVKRAGTQVVSKFIETTHKKYIKALCYFDAEDQNAWYEFVGKADDVPSKWKWKLVPYSVSRSGADTENRTAVFSTSANAGRALGPSGEVITVSFAVSTDIPVLYATNFSLKYKYTYLYNNDVIETVTSTVDRVFPAGETSYTFSVTHSAPAVPEEAPWALRSCEVVSITPSSADYSFKEFIYTDLQNPSINSVIYYMDNGIVTSVRTGKVSDVKTAINYFKISLYKNSADPSSDDHWDIDINNDWGQISATDVLNISSDLMECYIEHEDGSIDIANDLIKIEGTEGFPVLDPGDTYAKITNSASEGWRVDVFTKKWYL